MQSGRLISFYLLDIKTHSVVFYGNHIVICFLGDLDEYLGSGGMFDCVIDQLLNDAVDDQLLAFG